MIVSNRIHESKTIEYKSEISSADELAKDICAIANVGGGFIIIGVEAPDLVPERIIGWNRLPNLETGLRDHLSRKEKPKGILSEHLEMSHYELPHAPSRCVTAIEIPDTNEPVTYRCEYGTKKTGVTERDEIFFREGSSTKTAVYREQIMNVILDKANKAHRQAQIAFDNGNYEEAYGEFSRILSSNGLDALAWIGKGKSSALLHDSKTSIASFKEVMKLDKRLGRTEFFNTVELMNSDLLQSSGGDYLLIDREGKVSTRRDVDQELARDALELVTAMEELASEFCEIFPESPESHLLQARKCRRFGNLKEGLLRLEKAETSLKGSPAFSQLDRTVHSEKLAMMTSVEQIIVKEIILSGILLVILVFAFAFVIVPELLKGKDIVTPTALALFLVFGLYVMIVQIRRTMQFKAEAEGIIGPLPSVGVLKLASWLNPFSIRKQDGRKKSKEGAENHPHEPRDSFEKPSP